MKLDPRTTEAFDKYVKTVEQQLAERWDGRSPFFASDNSPREKKQLMDGKLVIAPGALPNPSEAPEGLIHDWVGAVFIPDTKIEDVLLTMRDYRRYKDFYHPGVVESKALTSEGFKDKFSVVLMNRVLVSKKALDSDCEASYFRVDDRHWYSISHTTRIQEVDDYGSESQHELPEDVGTGLIWRLTSITRFEERDGGVFMELEAIALSRDIPASLHWLVAPIVRRASKSSLALSLEQTEKAIHPNSESAKLPADFDLFDRGFRVLAQQ